MEARRCSECGAVFKDRPALASETPTCPLCGAELKRRERVVLDADDYRSSVRELRAELERLRRGGAEAV